MDNQYIDDATRRDLSRQDATATDTDFTLSLEEVAERYARAGHARTLRSLQRYCVSGHLDAQKIATTTGDKYLVTPQSVARHIAQIKEFAALEAVATFRDVSRPVATAVAPETPAAPQPIVLTTGPSMLRPTCRDRARQRACLLSWKRLFRRQVSDRKQRPHTTRRDRARQNQPRQGRRRAMSRSSNDSSKLPAMNATSCASRSIAKTAPSIALIERDQETNYLVRGLQEMLTPLLGRWPPPGRSADLHAVVHC